MLDNSTLIDALHSVTTIPLVPFRGGQIDFHAHIKNIRYLMSHNYLSDGRPRVICVAGTSLIHQIGPDDQNELLKVTSEAMRNEGILISALIPNPLSSVGKLIEVQSQYARPPDAYLIMPVSGIYSSRGLYQNLKTISDRYGSSHQARFLFYHRQQRDRDQIIKLVCDSPFFIGLKVGTIADEVPVLTNGIRDNGIVIWGKGDRSTQAARLGAKGHTSGISVIYAKAGDLINNAQRSGDFEKS
ncbi:MAG: hypothetical protein OEQ53_04005, partial [Saprospiraceae bacterium]|nr:hypothetical protein [Saprospiraceae bacterium]